MQDAQATEREGRIVEESLREFSELQTYRVNFGMQWEETASLMMPTQRNTFFFGNYNYPGVKKTQLQVDATAMLANWQFSAICDAMMTPFSSTWHMLRAADPKVQKSRQVREWFEDVNRILADMRYRPTAAFRRNNQAIWQLVGAFGNGPLFIDQLHDMRGMPTKGIRYKAVPLGEIFVRENHQGQIDGYCRWFRLTAPQAMCVPGWKDKLPEGIIKAAEKNSQAPFDFLQRVCPNQEYEPRRKDAKGKIFSSYYIALNGKVLLEEDGYRSFPMAFCRYSQGPGEVYARGWAMDVLPSLKTLNSQKTTFLKQAHRAADPVILGADDGQVGLSLRPGAYNPGTMSWDGKRLVDILPSGNIQMSEKAMEAEAAIIDRASLNSLFRALVDNPNMTATQVVELINQKGIYLAPMAGTMAPEYLGTVIHRELDIAHDIGILPPPPRYFLDAGGEYEIDYTNPLAKSARAGDAAGFLRTVESALQVAGQTNDPSHLDPFAFERAWPAIADIQSVPESWMASPEELAAKRQQRAKDVARQQQVASLPGQAAIMKAQAYAQEHGGGIPAQQQQQQAA